MDARYFSDKVVKWYVQNKRDLPFRENSDPYKIWLSEVILQQTRVIQGIPYYERFIAEFPTLHHLAAASEQTVLRLWQGLGYYSRARNLHKCAREIVSRFDGVFPNTYAGLRSLPGIGDYTAAAIASISFREKVAVVDGNVYRVLSRVFGIANDIRTTQGKKTFRELAQQLMTRRPDLHNQAIMEFGAIHCTPQNPDCPNCPFQNSCVAAINGLQRQLPVKSRARASKRRYFYYLVFRRGKSLLMKKREGKDIWHGLYDFYLIEKSRKHGIESILSGLSKDFKIDIDRESLLVSRPYHHVLTHQFIFSRFIVIDRFSGSIPNSTHQFYSAKKIATLPKPVLISRFLQDALLC